MIRHRPRRSSRSTLRFLGLALVALFAPILSGAIPDWWLSRGVVAPPQPGVVDNDCAALNVGQLKTLAFAAYAELAAPGSVGAGPEVEALIKTWVQTGAQGQILIGSNGRPIARPATAETADFAAVNVGQLKTVAQPFYNRLIAIGHADEYPWSASTDPAADFALANAGPGQDPLQL